MSIEISNETEYDVDLQEVEELARFVLNALFVSPFSDVMITFVEPPVIEELHLRWLGLAGPTDVMSFPMDELRPGSAQNPTGPGNLGDIVLCPLVAAAQARKAGHSTREELLLLTTHSLLHLLGYDHGSESEEKEMFALQRKLTLAFLATRNHGGAALPSFTDFSHLMSHETTDAELFKLEEAAWKSAHEPEFASGLTSAQLSSSGKVKVARGYVGPLGQGQGIDYLNEVAASELHEPVGAGFAEDTDQVDFEWPQWPDEDELDEEAAAGAEWLSTPIADAEFESLFTPFGSEPSPPREEKGRER